jgi:hypothetical protein
MTLQRSIVKLEKEKMTLTKKVYVTLEKIKRAGGLREDSKRAVQKVRALKKTMQNIARLEKQVALKNSAWRKCFGYTKTRALCWGQGYRLRRGGRRRGDAADRRRHRIHAADAAEARARKGKAEKVAPARKGKAENRRSSLRVAKKRSISDR